MDHITLAFLDDSQENLDVISVIEGHMNNVGDFSLCFDKLDAFTSTSAITIEQLQGIIEQIKMPSFILPLRVFEYREYKGKTIKSWDLFVS